MLASGVAVAQFASNTTRRVVGQWGGAGGACCEDHLAFCGELLGLRRLDSAWKTRIFNPPKTPRDANSPDANIDQAAARAEKS